MRSRTYFQQQTILTVALAVLALGFISGCVVDYRDSNVQVFDAGEAAALDGKQLYFTFARSDFEEELMGHEHV